MNLLLIFFYVFMWFIATMYIVGLVLIVIAFVYFIGYLREKWRKK